MKLRIQSLLNLVLFSPYLHIYFCLSKFSSLLCTSFKRNCRIFVSVRKKTFNKPFIFEIKNIQDWYTDKKFINFTEMNDVKKSKNRMFSQNESTKVMVFFKKLKLKNKTNKKVQKGKKLGKMFHAKFRNL